MLALRSMATPLPSPPSLDDVLAGERTQPGRHEYLGGMVRAMTGGTAAHNRIVQNLAAAFRAALVNTPCEAFVESMKVLTASAFTYPDIVVTCSPIPGASDLVSDAVLIVEVLSPGTQSWDRGGKWQACQTIPTLEAYLLVAQDEPRVERHARERQGWSYEVFEGLGHEIAFARPALPLKLAQIYARIEFPPGPRNRLL